MLHPVEKLQQIAQAARDVVPEAADWLERGLKAYLDGAALEAALDMTGAPGQPTARTAFFRARRDACLRHAWRLVTDDPVSAWGRSLLLDAEARRFESIIWPRLRRLERPPETLTPCRAALFHAIRTGQPLPRLRQLHTICTGVIPQ